jgi:hypothetical protein
MWPSLKIQLSLLEIVPIAMRIIGRAKSRAKFPMELISPRTKVVELEI